MSHTTEICVYASYVHYFPETDLTTECSPRWASRASPQLVCKLFTTLRLLLWLKKLTNTAYHQQANGRMERTNFTLVAKLRYFAFEQQRYWDSYIQPFMYVHTAQTHRPMGTPPSNIIIPRIAICSDVWSTTLVLQATCTETCNYDTCSVDSFRGLHWCILLSHTG